MIQLNSRQWVESDIHNCSPLESEKLYHYFVKGNHDLVLRINPASKIVFVNKSWEQRSGYSQSDRIKLNLFYIIHPDSGKHCREIFNKILKGKSMNLLKLYLLRKTADRLCWREIYFPLYQNKKLVQPSFYFHDIIAIKKSGFWKIHFLRRTERSEKKYRAFVERVSDGLVSMNKNWCFTFIKKSNWN